MKKQVELLDFGGFILGMLAGLAFFSRVTKYILEKMDLFNYSSDNYQELVEEATKQEAENKIKKELECKNIIKSINPSKSCRREI